MGPVHFWGHANFLPVLPESLIHAWIPTSHENLAELGEPHALCSCPRARNCIFSYASIGVGVHEILQVTLDKIFWLAKKKTGPARIFPGILPKVCLNFARILSELVTLVCLFFFGGGGGRGALPPPPPPPPPPHLICLCEDFLSSRKWMLFCK